MIKIRNGVDLASVEQYVGAVKQDPKLAQLTFRARSTWNGGTRAEVTVGEFIAGGQTASRPDRQFTMAVDEPAQLGGADSAPNPVEYLAAGLCGCLTAGIATNAALFGTDLEKLEVEVEVDIDLLGILGLDRSVPNHASAVRYHVNLKGPGAREKILKAKETIDKKSAIRTTLEHPIKVTTTVNVED